MTSVRVKDLLTTSRLVRLAAAAGLALAALPAGSFAAGQVATASPMAAAAAPTPRGSIVFIKGNNVWLARPDGSGAYQSTFDGTSAKPYRDPTMSDAGIIAVMRGDRIIRMTQNGTVLNTMTPEDLFIEGAGTTLSQSPIFEPVISPDGSKIAYSQARATNYSGTIRVEALTGFTRADRYAGLAGYGLIEASDPSWLTNNRVVVRKYGDIHLFTLGSSETQRWFTTSDTHPDDYWWGMADPEVSPDGRHYVVSADGGALVVGNVTGNPRTGVPAPPQANCHLISDQDPGEDPPFGRASWGPDSDAIVYEEYGNLWIATGIGACDASTETRKIISAAIAPDWSPAPLAPAPRSFGLVRKPVVSGKAKVGRSLAASKGSWSPSPSSYRYQWLRNGRPIKAATARTYRLKRADRGKQIAVRVTVSRPHYKARAVVSGARRVK